MRRTASVVLVLAAVACTIPQPVEQLAPQTWRAPVPPVAAAQAAARQLALDGFDIVAADANGGIVSARRTGDGQALNGLLRCKWPAGSMGDLEKRATLNVTVVATADTGNASRVVVRSRVVAFVVGMESADDREATSECASNGAIEDRIRTALHGA